MKIIGIFFVLSFCFLQADFGHRLGSEASPCKKYPENSLEVFQCAIKNKFFNRKSFAYFETDIQETKDHKIVLFHHKSKPFSLLYQKYQKNLVPDVLKVNTFFDLIPYKKSNKKVYLEVLKKYKNIEKIRSIRIKDLNLSDIQKFKLYGKKYKIPTLKSILEYAKDRLPQDKKIMLEIKSIYTKEGRKTFLDMVEVYKKYLNIDLLLRLGKEEKKHYKYLTHKKTSKNKKPQFASKLVGGLDEWCKILNKKKIFILRAGGIKYDLCSDVMVYSLSKYRPF